MCDEIIWKITVLIIYVDYSFQQWLPQISICEELIIVQRGSAIIMRMYAESFNKCEWKWSRHVAFHWLIIGKESKLCKIIYDQLLYLFNDDQYKANWLMIIKSILEEYSMAEVWENQTFGTIK